MRKYPTLAEPIPCPRAAKFSGSRALQPVEPRLGPGDDDVAKTLDGTVNTVVSFKWECDVLCIYVHYMKTTLHITPIGILIRPFARLHYSRLKLHE